MTPFIIFNSDGAEVKRGVCPDDMVELQKTGASDVAVLVDVGLIHEPDVFQYVDGEVTVAPEVESELDYATLRRLNYPSVEDQLDTIYHHGLEAWRETITEVKEQFPKDS